MRLGQQTGVTDDRCHTRCRDLLDWFVWETRGLMSDGEAHNVLDMLLNRLASDTAGSLNDKVTFVSARLAQQEKFVDMDTIEAVLQVAQEAGNERY